MGERQRKNFSRGGGGGGPRGLFLKRMRGEERNGNRGLVAGNIGPREIKPLRPGVFGGWGMDEPGRYEKEQDEVTGFLVAERLRAPSE